MFFAARDFFKSDLFFYLFHKVVARLPGFPKHKMHKFNKFHKNLKDFTKFTNQFITFTLKAKQVKISSNKLILYSSS